MVGLVQHSEKNLGVRVDGQAWVLVMVASLLEGREPTMGEEREYSWGVEEMFHEYRGEFDEICGTPRAGDVVVFCAANHS